MIKEQARGGRLFVLVAVISAVAALVPLLRGRSVNLTLLIVAAFWLVVAIVVVTRGRSTSGAGRK